MRSTVCILGLIVIGAVVSRLSRARVPSMSSTSVLTPRRPRARASTRSGSMTVQGALTPIGLVAETPESELSDGQRERAVRVCGQRAPVVRRRVERQRQRVCGREGFGETHTAQRGSRRAAASPCHLALDRTGRYLAVANYSGGNYSLLPVDSDGRLQAAVGRSRRQTGLCGPPAKGARAHGRVRPGTIDYPAHSRQRAQSDAGVHVSIRRPVRRPSTTCCFVGRCPQAPGRGTMRSIRVSEWVFTINEQGATITTFAWDAKVGSLTEKSSVPTRPAEVKTGIDSGDPCPPERPVRLRFQPRARHHCRVQRRQSTAR